AAVRNHRRGGIGGAARGAGGARSPKPPNGRGGGRFPREWSCHKPFAARVGDYATVGQSRVAVIDADSFWIYGYFEETQIHGVHVGDPARIKLMGYRQTLTGYVESITRGINDQDSKIDRYGLPDVNPVFTWVRLAQRIPVRVAIEAVPPGILLAS